MSVIPVFIVYKEKTDGICRDYPAEFDTEEQSIKIIKDDPVREDDTADDLGWIDEFELYVKMPSSRIVPVTHVRYTNEYVIRPGD